MKWLCETPSHLPAHVRRFPLQDVLCERRRLQLIFVKRQFVDNHRLTVDTEKPHHRMGRARWLKRERMCHYTEIHNEFNRGYMSVRLQFIL